MYAICILHSYTIPTGWFHRIGSSFKEQYTNRNEKAGKYRNVCNSVFTGWDFNITQKQLAELRSKSVKRKLQVCTYIELSIIGFIITIRSC